MRLIAKDSTGELLRLTVTGYDYLDRAAMLALDGELARIRATTAPESRNLQMDELFAILLARVNFVVGAAGIESVVYKTYRVTN
ncbi:hypothetical protein Trco_008320 [Trichoderma cornu-damae]|uniref:Uncharacterized protein n=1 Tax=Trichoderma cornu-damae TaxID=654480 RepID=A0A9P8QDZ5_9HYPO|nr:hypothetical protein Trco_008320 [Trichoderma cornu-damae]